MSQTLQLPIVASAEAKLTVNATGRSITCSIPMACSRETVYAAWADVANWHTWDPDTKWARLDGAFATSCTGKLAPQKGMAVDIVVSEATPNQSFTVIARVLGNRMIFVHTLQEVGGGLTATHEARFEGWLSGLFMKTVGADVAKGLPLTLTRLKSLCESR